MASEAKEFGGPSRTGIWSLELGRISENSEHRTPNAELPTAEILRILRNWGIHTLGQLAALDKEELRNRLGTEAVRLWERANGTATRLLKFVQPTETFEESFEFDHEIETAEPLLFILRRFLEQLSLRLSSIYLVARELTLTITFSDLRQVRYETDSSDWRDESAVVATATRTGKQTNPSAVRQSDGLVPRRARTYGRVFKIPQPTNDVDLLFRMLQTHLEDFKSKHPIVAVALSAEPSRPASQQFGLFETALRNPQQLYETLARLTALVGSDRIGTPILEETHRPDAFRMEPFTWQVGASPGRTGGIPNRPSKGAADTAASTANKCDGHRPPLQGQPVLRRFRPPARTSIFISEHRHLESDKMRGQIIEQAGPFLLSGNWWDEKAWARAEWDMQLEYGELVRAHEANGTWKLDGLYD